MNYPWSYTAQPQAFYPPLNYSEWSSSAPPYASYEQPPQQPYYQEPPSPSPFTYTSYTPSPSPYTPHHVESQEDILPQFVQYQTSVYSRFDEPLDQLTTEMRELPGGVDRWEKTFGETTVLLRDIHKMLLAQQTQEGFSDQDQSITNPTSETIIEETILPKVSELREEVPRVDVDEDEVKEEVLIFPKVFELREVIPKEEVKEEGTIESKGEEPKSEESKIEDSKQEEKGSTEIALNEDVGLLNVGDVHVKEDVKGLKAILAMSRDHEIPTFEPLTPNPNLSEPLQFHVPTFELTIIPMADQSKEGEGQALHGTSFIGPFRCDLFSTYHDPYYPYVLHGYIIEFIKVVAIVHSYICMQSLKLSNSGVWDDGKFPLCGIG